MSRAYNTPAHNALTDFFSAHPDKHFTAEQLVALLCTGEPDAIGKSTVYRQLARLCEENVLRRFEEAGSGGSAVYVYQYNDRAGDCEHHFHLKCSKCGKVLHLGCDRTHELIDHIRACHDFTVDCGQSILYGLCADCAPGRIRFSRDTEHILETDNDRITKEKTHGNHS